MPSLPFCTRSGDGNADSNKKRPLREAEAFLLSCGLRLLRLGGEWRQEGFGSVTHAKELFGRFGRRIAFPTTTERLVEGNLCGGDGAFTLHAIFVQREEFTLGIQHIEEVTETSIGYAAFEGCTNLTSVTIPEGVTSIGDTRLYYHESKCAERPPVGRPHTIQ